MNSFVKKIVTVAATAALTLSSAAALAAAPLQLGVPDDGTNLSRGIKLLEAAGFIKVDPAAGYTPEIKDITDYLYNVEVTPVAANTLPSTLGDFAASTINGTYAVPYGLIPSRDALLIEKQDENGENPYVNVIVARTADKDNEVYQKVVEAYQTQRGRRIPVGEFITRRSTRPLRMTRTPHSPSPRETLPKSPATSPPRMARLSSKSACAAVWATTSSGSRPRRCSTTRARTSTSTLWSLTRTTCRTKRSTAAIST